MNFDKFSCFFGEKVREGHQLRNLCFQVPGGDDRRQKSSSLRLLRSYVNGFRGGKLRLLHLQGKLSRLNL